MTTAELKIARGGVCFTTAAGMVADVRGAAIKCTTVAVVALCSRKAVHAVRSAADFAVFIVVVIDATKLAALLIFCIAHSWAHEGRMGNVLTEQPVEASQWKRQRLWGEIVAVARMLGSETPESGPVGG